MKRAERDKLNYQFTERWVSEHLPHGVTLSTTMLYAEFIDCLIEQNRPDMPTRSAFLSRLNKMKFIRGKAYPRTEHKMLKWWEKIVEPAVPCKYAAAHDRMKAFLKQSWFVNVRSR